MLQITPLKNTPSNPTLQSKRLIVNRLIKLLNDLVIGPQKLRHLYYLNFSDIRTHITFKTTQSIQYSKGAIIYPIIKGMFLFPF